VKVDAFSLIKIRVMRYRINKYQVVYESGARDTVKPASPIYTNDYEAVRTRLIEKHTGHGKKVVGVNLDYEELK
jgi:hypothetical protein